MERLKLDASQPRGNNFNFNFGRRQLLPDASLKSKNFLDY
jgi:hypothetical protein